MPHSPGCPGRCHRRDRDTLDKPCEAFRIETNRRLRMLCSRGDCGRCTRQNVLLSSHAGEKMCNSCYSRWRRRGFEGAGPGPGFCPALERAQEHEPVLRRLTVARAAEELHVTPRTVARWRALLREAA